MAKRKKRKEGNVVSKCDEMHEQLTLINSNFPGFNVSLICKIYIELLFSMLPKEYNLVGLKGYLCYKTIFCRKVALDAQLTNFFI